MKTGYTVSSGLISNRQKFFIVSNYHPMNMIKVYGFTTMPKINRKYDIGVWKLKKCKLCPQL